MVVGLVIVGGSIGATGFSRRLLNPFRVYLPDKTVAFVTAPDLAPGDWVNSAPLKLSELRGRVVLIEFWTFGCYNCRNTLPSVKRWNERYREQGLTVIGVHSPEFAYERKAENLRREVASLGIAYPVVTDNDYQTWDAYGVSGWPTSFLLDKQGRIRWQHVGEGDYDEAERLIQQLLSEPESLSEDKRAVPLHPAS
jgi:thiol-disulfide isomerase/thioredoxin